MHVNRANPYTATLATVARRETRRLVVDMEDWDGFGGYSSYAGRYDPAGFLLTFYEQTFPRSADEVVVVSGLLQSRMLRAGVPGERISVIPNGFDPDLFHPGVDGRGARSRYGLDGSPVIIYAGSFWPFELEVHRLALRAFARVLGSEPEAKLMVVGRSSRAIADMAKDFGIEKRVAFTGFVPRSEVPGLMAAADVALHMISGHPFHLASSPMIVPEYMAMGKPVVAPALGELRSMLGSGAGLLVGRPDPQELASAVIRVAEDAALRRSLGARAAERARKMYSYELLAERLADVYAGP